MELALDDKIRESLNEAASYRLAPVCSRSPGPWGRHITGRKSMRPATREQRPCAWGTCLRGKAEKSLFHSRAQRSLTMFREELESRQGSVLCVFAHGSTLVVRRKRDGEGQAVVGKETQTGRPPKAEVGVIRTRRKQRQANPKIEINEERMKARKKESKRPFVMLFLRMMRIHDPNHISDKKWLIIANFKRPTCVELSAQY